MRSQSRHKMLSGAMLEATSQPHGKPMRLCAVPKPRSPAGSTLAAHPDPSPHQGRPQTPPDPRDLPEITPKTARRLTPDRQTLLDGAARGVACARVCVCAKRGVRGSPATRNRARDHLIAACVYSQMLCQLSYGRSASRVHPHILPHPAPPRPRVAPLRPAPVAHSRKMWVEGALNDK